MPVAPRLITLNLGSQTIGLAEFRVAHGVPVLVNYRLRELPLDPGTGERRSSGIISSSAEDWAQFQMSNDGTATGDASSAWPGDLFAGGFLGAGATLENYANILLAKGYLKGGDIIKLYNAPSAVFTATVNVGPPESISASAGTAALRVYPVKDADPSNAIFAVTHNYDYDTALGAAGIPYGTKGFISIQKGGNAATYRQGQDTLAGWGGPGNEIKFQNQIGLKTGDTEGVVTAGNPANMLQFP
jgi:hypothetical protein